MGVFSYKLFIFYSKTKITTQIETIFGKKSVAFFMRKPWAKTKAPIQNMKKIVPLPIKAKYASLNIFWKRNYYKKTHH